MKKIMVFFITLIIFGQGICYAASHEPALDMPDPVAKRWILNLAGTPVWLDKNNKDSNYTGFASMNNLDHLLIGNIDIDNMIIEIVKDNGEKFYWEPSLSKRFKAMNSKNFKIMSIEIQCMFYLSNPYEKHADWSNKAWQNIKKRRVYVGMTKEMCLMAWGPPEDKSKTTTAYGTMEQWIYNDMSFLYLENGVLSIIQN